jgi:hypothetical protein
VLGGPDKYFDVSSFILQDEGHLGTLGRNTLIGPGLATLDVSVTRSVQLSDQQSLQFRLEVFNLLNRANFSHPQNRGAGGGVIVFNDLNDECLAAPPNPACLGNGIPVGNAATIFSTTSSSRQLQLGLRYTF